MSVFSVQLYLLVLEKQTTDPSDLDNIKALTQGFFLYYAEEKGSWAAVQSNPLFSIYLYVRTMTQVPAT